MPNNANFLAKNSKALPSSYFDSMGKGNQQKAAAKSKPALKIGKANLSDQDNPTNPQANGYGGGGIQGSKPNLTNRLNKLIGGK